MFFQYKKTLTSKYSAYIAGALYIVLILAVSLISGATAEAKTAREMSADELARSYSYYQVLGQCVSTNMKGDIQIGSGDNGNALPVTWFDNNTASGNVYTERNIDCKDIATKALGLWGWGNDGGQFLKDMGYNWDVSYPGYHGPGGLFGGDERRQDFFNSVKAKVYNGGNPYLSREAEYLMYLEAAKAQPCSMQVLARYSGLNDTQKSWVDSNKQEASGDYTKQYRKIQFTSAEKVDGKYVAEDFGVVFNTAQSSADANGLSSSTSYNSYGYRSGGSSVGGKTESCDWYVSGLSDRAQQFANYATSNNIAPPGVSSDRGTDGDKDSATTCVIDGVGWIVCGMSRWLASVMDGIYGLLTLYLTTPTVNTDINDQGNALYRVWSAMRNLANAAFVVAFLIIIFSQLTGAGINNYGIKKALPRLVVAAILVNVSYWIAAAAVDLSNILGSGIYNLIRAISDNLGGITVPVNVWEVVLNALLAGGGIAVTGGAIAATAAAVSTGVVAGSTLAMAALWVAIPAVLAGILAVIIAFAILAARQALIIILIVLSPLAFVALLLPNTEGFFKTWRKSLITMLIFYPIFSVIFAGSQLAAIIILGAAGGSTGDNTTAGPVGHIIVLALFVQVIPLIMTPMLVKFSGGLIGQLAGIVNNKGKGLIDRSRKVRDRKLGLAANEIMSNAARVGGRNPFARTARFMGRTYRRSQNDNRVDADRQKILDSQNQGAYLGTDRAAQLSTSLKNAQHQVNTLEGEHNAEFEAQKDVDMTYRLNLANQKVDVRKLQDQMDYKKTLSSQTNIAGHPNAGMINEARTAEENLNMYRDAVGRTDGVLKQEYAEELLNRPGLANMAAGIDVNGGAEKVKATAIDAQQKAYQANVSAFSMLHRHDSLTNSALDSRARNTSLSIEEREAASRGIVESGDIDAITEHQNYLATAIASARTPEELENVKALQKAFGNSIGSSPGKPVGLGAADIAKYKVGNYIAPSSTHDINVEYDLTTNSYTSVAPRPMDPTEIQTLDTIEQKGISMDKWTGMDKADIIRTINLASSGTVSSQRQRDMATSIDETLGDKRWYGRMQEREINLLKELRSRLP